MSVVDELRSQIATGRIIFDSPPARAARLESELLGENAGTRVTTRLQQLVLELSRLARIRVSDLIRSAGDSHHVLGRAVDIGNQEIAGALLPQVATDARVQELGIDEIIFDASVAGQSDRNVWNYNAGKRHQFSNSTLNEHRTHIHFSVTGD